MDTQDKQAQAQSGEWVMVPREPTKAMIDASCKIKLERLKALRDGRGRSSGVASAVQEEWAAMLSAAPQSQAAEPFMYTWSKEPDKDGVFRKIPLYTHPPQPTQDAKDASRYRWLRDFADSYTWDYLGGIGDDRVEAAVDAAMAKESGR